MAEETHDRGPSGPGAIRESDIEPYTALRWVGTLFKVGAVFLLVALIAEFIAGLRVDGLAAMPMLLGELTRTAVLAIVLWGAGDMVRLAIDLGHDVRAGRVLLARLASRIPPVGEPEEAAEQEEEPEQVRVEFPETAREPGD